MPATTLLTCGIARRLLYAVLASVLLWAVLLWAIS